MIFWSYLVVFWFHLVVFWRYLVVFGYVLTSLSAWRPFYLWKVWMTLSIFCTFCKTWFIAKSDSSFSSKHWSPSFSRPRFVSSLVLVQRKPFLPDEPVYIRQIPQNNFHCKKWLSHFMNRIFLQTMEQRLKSRLSATQALPPWKVQMRLSIIQPPARQEQNMVPISQYPQLLKFWRTNQCPIQPSTTGKSFFMAKCDFFW